MPATATVELNSVDRAAADRAAINRANAEHSTGPRTDAGKQQSSRNALRHGLTARTAVLSTEDPAAYEQHCRQFRDEYQPATATETQLVQQLADTSWRLNRIPLLEAGLFKETSRPGCTPHSVIQSLSMLGLHGARLSRQFQKTLDQLRDIQSDRRKHERRDLKDDALLELHKPKEIPQEPADHGFVFSEDHANPAAGCVLPQHDSQTIEHFRAGT